jgi:predicted nucleic-acid-binding protein
MVWVMRSRYGVSRSNIVAAIRQICDTQNVVLDRGAVEAGFAAMDGGADFADGVIAYEGRWLGGETFVSFDKKAVEAIAKQGLEAKLLA